MSDKKTETKEKTPEEICPVPAPNLVADVLPKRFLNAEKGDAKLGMQRWTDTLRWRAEQKMDGILHRPHPHFDFIKNHSTQYYHKRAKNGSVCYYEVPKAMKVSTLKKAGISIQDCVQHFLWITEYLWRVLDTNDESKVLSVLDLSGVGFSDFVGDVKTFVQAVSAVSGQHYPERSYHIFVVNAPSSFSWIWRAIKGWMDPVTVAKTHILSGKDFSELHAVVDKADVPVRYGGTCACEGGCENSADEIGMREVAAAINAYHKAHPQ